MRRQNHNVAEELSMAEPKSERSGYVLHLVGREQNLTPFLAVATDVL